MKCSSTHVIVTVVVDLKLDGKMIFFVTSDNSMIAQQVPSILSRVNNKSESV